MSLPNILTTVFNNAKQFEKEQPEQNYIYVTKDGRVYKFVED